VALSNIPEETSMPDAVRGMRIGSYAEDLSGKISGIGLDA